GDANRPNSLKRTSPSSLSLSPPRPQSASSNTGPNANKRQRLDSDPTNHPAASNLSSSRRSNSSNPDLAGSPYLHTSSSPAPEGTPPPPGAPPVTVIHSADIVQSDIKQYTTWFLDPDMKEPSDPMPTVELVYLTKTYRESFSLLRPKPLVAAMATLSTSSSTSNLLTGGGGGGSSSRGNTPPPHSTGSSKSHATHHDDPNSEYDPVTDLIETIRMLVQYSLICPPASVKSIFSDDSSATHGGGTHGGIVRRLERARNRRSLVDFVAAVADFNREFAKCKREGMVLGYTKRRLNSPATSEDTRKAILAKMTEFAPAELVHHVLYQAYTRAVAPHADVLQKYEAFSNTVYGEVNPVFVDMMLDKVKIESKDTFVDLGSGIGNVVLHVAARTECSAYGIEIQSAAADLAQRQLDEFRARLKFLNRRLGHVELYEGDMLTHAAIPGLIARADVIFCNNYVFQPELNRALVELFLDCKDGTKIVTLREFAPVDNRITSRNVHSVEALFDVECFDYHADFVSWTDQAGRWYVHTMNRARVRKWCEANGMAY
ncbi:histone methylation protein DOT1-domain-containing protein, partial [Catenaria anguillulae PL171]